MDADLYLALSPYLPELERIGHRLQHVRNIANHRRTAWTPELEAQLELVDTASRRLRHLLAAEDPDRATTRPDWSQDPALAAAQRRRDAGPRVQAHADTHGRPPNT